MLNMNIKGNYEKMKSICQKLNALMLAEPDFTYTKDFHPIMMKRSKEYCKLYNQIKFGIK